MVRILRQSAPQVIHRMLSLRPLPAFQDNYIWTLSNAAGEAIVVDPGDAAPVLAAAREGLRPVAILLTHHHDDHIGGAAALLAEFRVPCYAPVEPRISVEATRVGQGDVVRIPALDLDLAVLEVHGHTRSHIAFHGGGHLFCGDSLFSLGCGRMFEGQPAQMLDALDRMAALPGDTLVCCGHEYTEANGRFARVAEPDNAVRDRRLEDVARLRAAGLPSVPSRMDQERACNPFLRVDAAGIQAQLRARGLASEARADAFAALRAWKDAF